MIPAGMSQPFRRWDTNPAWFLLLSLYDFVSADHLAPLVRDPVREGRDVSCILAVQKEERGQPPYCLVMMLARCSTVTAALSTPFGG